MPTRLNACPAPSCGGSLLYDAAARELQCLLCGAVILASTAAQARRILARLPIIDVEEPRGAALEWGD